MQPTDRAAERLVRELHGERQARARAETAEAAATVRASAAEAEAAAAEMRFQTQWAYTRGGRAWKEACRHARAANTVTKLFRKAVDHKREAHARPTIEP